MIKSNIIPRLTIGLPVYNGEKHIQKKLNNILLQSFQDFEIIIYDSSNDTTPKICKNYQKQDSRIQYIHENKRSGWIQAFLNLMKEAKYEYFIIASVDDLWSTNFLEDCVKELDDHPSAVSSLGTIAIIENQNIKKHETHNIWKKISEIFKQRLFRNSFQPSFESKGPFKEKARKILRNTWYRHINGVIRSSALPASVIKKEMILWDWAFILNLAKLGDLHFAKNSQYYVTMGDTTSRQGIFMLFKSQNAQLNEYFSPASTFTFWCIQKIGLTFFLTNIDYFIWLNFIHNVGILSGLYQKVYLFCANILKKVF
jgi:glycosyltransferase involved in cell wall biosynthesis